VKKYSVFILVLIIVVIALFGCEKKKEFSPPAPAAQPAMTPPSAPQPAPEPAPAPEKPAKK